MTEQALPEARLAAWRSRCEQVLASHLGEGDAPTRHLLEAMRYSTLGGGKRLRPVLVYCTGEACGATTAALDDAAAAVEFIHVYSLVHDDLPAMDDDALRRGRPTCHKAHGEGTAILVGDALQALAFQVLAGEDIAAAGAAARLHQIQVLARHIGIFGMAGGQAIDLAAAGHRLDAPQLELMHRRKTGALIEASVLLGAIGANVLPGSARYQALQRYGAELGLAFQIQDDVLDVSGDTSLLGKQTGADAAHDKPTYPSLHGLDGAARLALAHRDAAIAALAPLGAHGESLAHLAHYVVDRRH